MFLLYLVLGVYDLNTYSSDNETLNFSSYSTFSLKVMYYLCQFVLVVNHCCQVSLNYKRPKSKHIFTTYWNRFILWISFHFIRMVHNIFCNAIKSWIFQYNFNCIGTLPDVCYEICFLLKASQFHWIRSYIILVFL